MTDITKANAGMITKKKDEDECRVDEHAYGVRGEELSDEFILRDPVSVFTGRTGTRRQRRVQHLLEQQIRYSKIRLAPGIVDE
jgi:hypothetical protein